MVSHGMGTRDILGIEDAKRISKQVYKIPYKESGLPKSTLLQDVNPLANRNTNNNKLVHLPPPGAGILESSLQRTPTTAKASQILVPDQKPVSSNLRTFIRNQNIQGYPLCLLLPKVDRLVRLCLAGLEICLIYLSYQRSSPVVGSPSSEARRPFAWKRGSIRDAGMLGRINEQPRRLINRVQEYYNCKYTWY